jgi:flagellar biosynthetic protein FliQ
MNAPVATEWFQRLLWTAVLAAGPVVLATVIIGLITAILQAATQVNDQAVAFGPKAIVVVLTLVVTGPWMLSQLMQFTLAVFSAMSRM